MQSGGTDGDLRFIKGVGEKKREMLSRLSVFTSGDLLWFAPRAYEDRRNVKALSEIADGETALFSAKVISPPSIRRTGRNLSVSTVLLSDGKESAKAIFFNREYTVKTLTADEEYLFFGKAEKTLLEFVFKNPDVEPKKEEPAEGVILPLYSLTAGLSQKTMRVILKNALEKYGKEIPDVLPDEVRKDAGLCASAFAFWNIHFPKGEKELEIARERLIFEEFFIFRCGLSMIRGRREEKPSATGVFAADFTPFLSRLPYRLTGAQSRVLKEIGEDFLKNRPMNRLVQGDVGSGKTILAAASAYAVIAHGFQAALMAPTEILARQHFEKLSPILEEFGIKTALLSSSLRAKEKREALEKVRSGEAGLVVGTHSVLSSGVEFQNLGLAIADEQHRFGVAQRAALLAKGKEPHLIVMSATPIPRTLALILYGDLEVSQLCELPPGRQKIDTFLIGDEKRARALGFVKKQIDAGGRAYFVCPAIEEGELLELKTVFDCEKELKESVLKEIPLAVVHGKMKSADKESAMRRFETGEAKILVSTTVIEVGVDVPSANIMVIENAERFGLSQLHQLRGRVGRGSLKSYCVLFSNATDEKTRARLKVIRDLSDGFLIAQEDLKLRGPGEFFGEKQHGAPAMRIADLALDAELLQRAVRSADSFLEKNIGNLKEGYPDLYRALKKMFEKQDGGIFN